VTTDTNGKIVAASLAETRYAWEYLTGRPMVAKMTFQDALNQLYKVYGNQKLKETIERFDVVKYVNGTPLLEAVFNCTKA
jgi:hypothetical protein